MLFVLSKARWLPVAQALNILLHVLLLGSLGVYVLVLVRVVLAEEDRTERFIRASALFCGAMIVVGSQAAGAGYAEFIVQALAAARPGTALLAAVIPGVLGVAIGAYLIHAMKRRGEDVTVRLLALIGMLAAASFASIYAFAMREHAGHLGSYAVPNLAFVVGLTLYVILNFQTVPVRAATTRRWLSANEAGEAEREPRSA